MSGIVWALVLLTGAVASADTLGSITSIEQFPSLAQVEFYLGEVWLQKCSATVITNKHVISAGKCFFGSDYNPTLRRVRVGTSTRGVGGDVLGVEAAYLHQDFGTLGQDADITVVALDDYLTLGVAVQQAPILGQGIELPGGLVLHHAGWGNTAEGVEVPSDDLYALDLTVNSHMDCLIKYIGQQEITENMICVGLSYTRGRDFDLNDMGGPLFYQGTLVGLFSFGAEAADDELPVVATSVGAYSDWIVNIAASN